MRFPYFSPPFELLQGKTAPRKCQNGLRSLPGASQTGSGAPQTGSGIQAWSILLPPGKFLGNPIPSALFFAVFTFFSIKPTPVILGPLRGGLPDGSERAPKVAKRPRSLPEASQTDPVGVRGGPVKNAKKCENGPENDQKTRHISKGISGISYMFPHILQAQNDPPILIYTPPGGGHIRPFRGLAGCPRGLAGLDRPSGNLNQKVPHFGAGWARSGPESAPNWPGFPDFHVFLMGFPGFLDSGSPHFRISRFREPTFPDFSILGAHISGFLDFPLPYFRTFHLVRRFL